MLLSAGPRCASMAGKDHRDWKVSHLRGSIVDVMSGRCLRQRISLSFARTPLQSQDSAARQRVITEPQGIGAVDDNIGLSGLWSVTTVTSAPSRKVSPLREAPRQTAQPELGGGHPLLCDRVDGRTAGGRRRRRGGGSFSGLAGWCGSWTASQGTVGGSAVDPAAGQDARDGRTGARRRGMGRGWRTPASHPLPRAPAGLAGARIPGCQP
ncbi:hypothetical protein V8E36_006472 [Tilletia maclaganii]